MIISILNQKGGVGKTTLSVHIASTLALAGYSVLLVDADQQKSSLDWAATRTEDPIFPVVGISTAAIHREIKLLKDKHDFIIIDGPPRVYEVARSVIAASDIVIIPVQPSPYDVWAAKEIIDLVNEVKATLQGLKKIKSAFIINRKIPNSVIGRDVIEALEQYKTKILESHICQRLTYAETAASGTTAIESDPNSLAGQEIKKLTEEIVKELQAE